MYKTKTYISAILFAIGLLMTFNCSFEQKSCGTFSFQNDFQIKKANDAQGASAAITHDKTKGKETFALLITDSRFGIDKSNLFLSGEVISYFENNASLLKSSFYLSRGAKQYCFAPDIYKLKSLLI